MIDHVDGGAAKVDGAFDIECSGLVEHIPAIQIPRDVEVFGRTVVEFEIRVESIGARAHTDPVCGLIGFQACNRDMADGLEIRALDRTFDIERAGRVEFLRIDLGPGHVHGIPPAIGEGRIRTIPQRHSLADMGGLRLIVDADDLGDIDRRDHLDVSAFERAVDRELARLRILGGVDGIPLNVVIRIIAAVAQARVFR